MGYSYAETSAITCLHCQKTFDGEVWFIIDAGDRPNLIERIKQGALHTFPCPHCQQAVTIDAPLLILRALGNPVLLFSPAQATTNDQDQEHARWLLGHLRDDMGDQWQDDWLTRGLRGISRDQLPSALSGDPKGVPGPANDGRGQLLNLLQQFIQADNWADSRLVVEAHPELLSARTDVVLLQLIEGVRGQYDADVEVRLNEYRELLARCREIGIAQAFAEKVGSAADETDVLTGLSANWQNAQVAVRRYQATGDRSALDEAIAMWERILEINSLSTDLEPLHIQAMNSAAATYLCRYLSCGFSSDLDHALSLLQKLVHLMPSNSPEQPGFLTNLGNGLRARYARSGDLADLEQAIDAWQRALNLTPRNMPARSVILCNLGAGLRVRYASRRDPADLDAAVDNFRDALQLVSPGDLGRGTIFNNLGNCLRDRYNIRGDSADLEAAVDSFQKAVDMALPNTPERALRLTNLGTGLHARYERKGNLADLEAAIDRFQQAVELIPLNATDRARCLDNLGTGLRTRYKRSGDPADLEAAVGYFRQAVELTPPGDPDRVGHLDDLGTGLHDRYNLNGDPADLEAAIDCYQQAIELTPPNDPDRASHLNSLGTGLHDRYIRNGDPADLETAVDYYRQAVELTPPNTSERAVYFSNIGINLRDRYERNGDPADLEAAVDSFRQAVELTSPVAPDRADYLSNLGTGLRMRYVRGGVLADLKAAIGCYQQAVELTPLDAFERTSHLTNLGNGLHDRYERNGDPADLDAAVDCYRQAVELTPHSAPKRGPILNNLGAGLHKRYLHNGDPVSLEAAVDSFRQAIELTPPGDLRRAEYLSNLSVDLRARFARNGDPADLAAAIDCCQQAVELIPHDTTHRAMILYTLAAGLHDRYDRSGDPADLEQAIQSYRSACTGGFLYNHNLVVVVARSWLYWATLRHNWYEAVEAFNYVRRATDILVTVQWDRAAKSDWLREVQGLAARGAYALSQRSQLSQSVEALEGGLARLLSEALEGNRRDLERLPSLGYGSLYGRYRMGTASWAALMQTQPYAGVDITVEEQTSHNRLNLLHETRAAIDAAIDDIRRVPGYEDFFRSLPYARIQALASLDTPVVYLATTSVGSLGLIVWPDTVEAIDIAVTERDLNRLLIEWEAQGNAATGGYLIAQLGVASALPAELAKTLPILGEKLMPLVDHLRTRGATGVTLIPTGRLSLLPLHAATYTRDGKTLCLLDDFVVAYTPSAQALAVARENVQQRASMPLRLAGVGNPSPNSRPLTYAKPELQSIVELMPAGAAQPLYERQATKPALAATLPRATVAHLSCHGSFNVAEPLDSGLMLGDGPWTLREILDQPKALETVRLVVLSACQTAITDFQNLPDEAIGLPAGLLQAGVPAIVGTLWSVNDASTALLMVRFYELMLSEYLRPHEALCRAQRWLRDLTMHDLEEYVARHEAIARAHAEAGDRMSDSLSHALNLKVFTADNPDAQPFRDPYYWAPFTFTGATEVIL